MSREPQRRIRGIALDIKNKEHLALRLNLPLSLLEDLGRYRRLHYKNHLVPKKDGIRTRKINPPSPKLKIVQRRITDVLLGPLSLPDSIHGYRRGRSIVTAALPHQGSRFLLIADIRDFYPNISHRRIYQMYGLLGCSPDVAKILTELTTHDGCVPQGAPTSSALANLHIRLSGLANRLEGLARKHDLRVTFFGDDILISGTESFRGLKSHIVSIIRSSGLALNEEKTSEVARPNERQHVLGIVMNSRGSQVDVPRRYRRRLKALLALCRRKGLDALRVPKKNALAYLRGKISFAAFVNKNNLRFHQELDQILAQEKLRKMAPTSLD